MSELIGLKAPVQPQAPADVIIDGTEATFAQDVIEASMQQPVIVDFWAEWCGPCKTLGPVIEKVVTAAAGAVKLVKIDTESNQQLAMQMRIQSIPTVYAFYQGQPVDGFMGALPESQVQAFVDKLIAAAGGAAAGAAGGDGAGAGAEASAEDVLERADTALAAGQNEQARDLYRAVLEQDQTNVKAYTGFARAMLAEGRLAEVQSLMEQVPEELLAQPEIISLAGMIGLAEQAASLPDTATLQAAVDANADDHSARHTLAQALLGRGQPEAGADHLLEIMRRDREWNDDGARQALLALFDALGQSAPLTVAYRKKLSALLFS